MVGIGPSLGGNQLRGISAFNTQGGTGDGSSEASGTGQTGGTGASSQAGQNGEQPEVTFAQVYAGAMPEHLTGRGVSQGDETTQQYYKQLKNLKGGEESQATFISYEA